MLITVQRVAHLAITSVRSGSEVKRNIVNALAEIAQQYPSLTAIEEIGGRKWSYRELWNVARATADQLMKDKGMVVALNLPRSADFVAALFGAWMAKKVVLILDPEWPLARTQSILEQTQPCCCISTPFIDQPSDCPNVSLECGIYLKDDPAYMIFTSGSSGKPKGTLVPHGGICRVLDAQIEAFALFREARNYWMHGIAFDASLSDIGTTLLCGGVLVIDPDICHASLFSQWEKYGITHVDLPPALLPHLEVDKAPSSLRTIVVGGQVCDADSIRRWCRKVRVVNVYGPTEATICTSYSICNESWDRPLIGDPIPGITYSIDLHTDELLISGDGVALEYSNEPELTRERFGRTDGVRLFHTRDRVLRLPNGDIQFLGRLDRQFKIHGKLICPEEIERLLDGHPDVIASAITLSSKEQIVVACIATKQSDASHFREYLAEELPKWMIPSRYLLVERIPALNNGKIDFNAVESMLDGHDSQLIKSERADSSVVTPMEAKLRSIFMDALERDALDLDLAFTQAGIDSLGIVRVLIEAENRGLSLSSTAINNWPTIRSLAKAIDSGLPLDDCFPASAILDAIKPLIHPSRNVVVDRKSPRNILMIGATGFFGSALLGELLTKHPEFRVTCLVRGGSKARVQEALGNHGYSHCTDFDCISGDITNDYLGLSREQWECLTHEIDMVIHSAADVSLVKSFESLYATNVLGTDKIIKFCAAGTPKMLHYISSLSVFVDALPLPEICSENDSLESTVAVFGGYAQSKWAGEKLVRLSVPELNTSIYRLGLLTANSRTGYKPPNDWFSGFMKNHDFSKIDDEARSCDFTPVDIAAAQAATLAAGNRPGTWHIFNPQQMTYGRLKNLAGESIEDNKFSGLCELALRNDNSPFRVFKTTKTMFSAERTRAALEELNQL